MRVGDVFARLVADVALARRAAAARRSTRNAKVDAGANGAIASDAEATSDSDSDSTESAPDAHVRAPNGLRVRRARGDDVAVRVERPARRQNFGATCYVNSLLQTLFFVAPFRRAVLEWNAAATPVVRTDDDDDDDDALTARSQRLPAIDGQPAATLTPEQHGDACRLMRELQRVFAHVRRRALGVGGDAELARAAQLQEGASRVVEPRGFVETLGLARDVQQDVQELRRARRRSARALTADRRRPGSSSCCSAATASKRALAMRPVSVVRARVTWR